MKNVVWLILGLSLAACHSDPYSGVTGNFSNTLKVQKPVIPDFPIKAQSIIDATEGQTVGANIRGFVQNGTPVISFENLPSWIGFDRGQLTISPPLGAATTILNGEYTFNIVLKSSTDSAEVYKKDMTVIVHKSAQTISVNGFEVHPIILEGQAYTSTIQITTSYLPVVLSGINLPEGVEIKSTVDPTIFSIRYTPSFTTVTNSNHSETYYMDTENFRAHWALNSNWTLNVIDSSGGAISIPAIWKVVDVRQDPVVHLVTRPIVLNAPATRQAQGIMTAKFALDVQDPNGESSPDVSILGSEDGGGLFLTEVAGVGSMNRLSLPYSLINVDWSQIPNQNLGQAKQFKVKACVLGGPEEPNHCAILPVAVNL